MSKTDFKALFELILMYFSDKEIKSFVNSIRKSEANEMDIIGEFDLEEGWIPLESIMQIKRIKEITKNVQDVICVVLDYPKSLNLPSPLFQLSPQNTHIRRLISFDNEKILKTNNSGTLIIPPITSQSNEHAVEAIGFLPTVTEAEVWAHFSQFGQISKVDLESYNAPCGAAFDADCEEDDDDTKIIKRTGRSFLIHFVSNKDMVNVLVSSHSYDGTPIRVQPKRIAPEFIESPPKQKVKSKKRSSLDYPPNRVMKFPLIGTKIQIKSGFEKYATVVSFDFESDTNVGYVRLKKSVANELLSVLENNGGILVDDKSNPGNTIKLPIEILKGQEEKLYWQILKEKESKNLLQERKKQSVHDTSRNAIKKKLRFDKLKSKKSSNKKKHSGSKVEVKSNGKRMMPIDDDADVDDVGSKTKGTRKSSRLIKRAKKDSADGDELANLLTGFSMK